MWDGMMDWLLTGAIETDEKMAMDLTCPGYHGDSGASRTAFRAEAEQDSGLIPNSIPG
jgi:hypothetical protein